MVATTYSNFNDETEGLEVAKAFPSGIEGKTILVTGVNLQGIGFSTAQAFASQAPAQVIIAGRSAQKLQECIGELQKQYPKVECRPLILDLFNQASVRKAANEILSWDNVPKIDIIVNNAGIMKAGEFDRQLSEQGIESHFATNHIGHFLFTNLIMPKVLKAAKSSEKGSTRIIHISSGAAESGGVRFSDINFDRKSKELPAEEQPIYAICERWGIPDAPNMTYVPVVAYVQSKAANILFGVGLTERLYNKFGILSLAVHPGTIVTEIGRYTNQEQIDRFIKRRNGMFKSVTAGASTPLVAALDPQLGPSNEKDGFGAYLKSCQLANAHPQAQSRVAADKLWKLSEELVQQAFVY